MKRARESNPKSSTGTILKTTTWGALIALLLVTMAWGFSCYFPGVQDDANAPTSAALAGPAQDSSTSTSGPADRSKETSFLSSALRQVSKLNPFSGTTASKSKEAALSAQIQSPTDGGSNPKSAAQPTDSNAKTQYGTQRTDDDAGAVLAAKISPDLKGVKSEASVDVIIQFRQPPSETDLAGEEFTKKAELPVVKAQLITVKGSNLSSLASHTNVAYISPDRPVRGALDHVITAVNGDVAYAGGWNGTGVGIAVVDSGVSSNYDMNSDGNMAPSRIVYSQNFVLTETTTADPYGHGTHVAGIIAGNAYDSAYLYNYPGVYRGIAPEARIINLRVLDSNGLGTDSLVIAAIQQAIALQSTYNIRVINLSVGRGVYESYTLDPLCQAVESAWKAGIVVVVAAGNMGQYNGSGTNGYATIGAPGNDPYVITVGATNTHGTGSQSLQTMTSYSSKGPTSLDHIVKPDLVAPGNHVLSRMSSSGNSLVTLYPALAAYPCNSSRNNCGSQFGAARYMSLSGTSMATPVVSGVAALLLQKNPLLTPDQVKARLMKTAWKGYSQFATATDLSTGTLYNIEQDIFSIGAGAVDASAALANTCLLYTSPSPRDLSTSRMPSSA